MSYPPPPPPGPPPHGYGYGGYPPQAWTPPPQIDPKQLKPSRLWYWLAPLPALIGVGIALVLLVGVIQQFDTDLDHLRTPGSVTVQLDEGDERGIYVQTAGAPGAVNPPRAVSCTVRGAREANVPLRGTSGLTLTVGGDEYVEQDRFTAPADGSYVVSCSEPPGLPVAVGPHIAVRRFFWPVIGMIAAFLIGVALTGVIAVVTGVRRSNHKQRLQREALQR